MNFSKLHVKIERETNKQHTIFYVLKHVEISHCMRFLGAHCMCVHVIFVSRKLRILQNVQPLFWTHGIKKHTISFDFILFGFTVVWYTGTFIFCILISL